MAGTAFLIPNWRFLVFLSVVYVIVGLYEATLPSATLITPVSLVGFIAAVVAGLVAGAVVSASVLGTKAGNWAATVAFIGVFALVNVITGAWTVLGYLAGVVTFAIPGIPAWLQWMMFIPCSLMLLWQILAFWNAIFGLGTSTGGDAA